MSRRIRWIAALALLAGLQLSVLLFEIDALWQSPGLGGNTHWTLALIHCDIAMAAIWTQRNRQWRFYVLVGSGALSLVLHGALFWLAVTAPPPAGKPMSSSSTALVQYIDTAWLLSLLHGPLVLLLILALRSQHRRPRFWIASGAAAALTTVGCYLLAARIITYSWEGINLWGLMVPLLALSASNFVSILFTAAIYESIARRNRWRQAFLLFVSFIVIATAISGSLEGMFNGRITRWGIRPPIWRQQWLSILTTLIRTPLCAAAITAMFALLAPPMKYKSEGAAEIPPVQAKFHSASRFSTAVMLVAAALFISGLNLVNGFLVLAIRIHPYEFARNGLVSELLFMAPHGLWAAQAGVSAIFLQCGVLTRWQRLLIVLVWAEISMAAFWGQIALNSWMRPNPSEFVAAIFHVVASAAVIAIIGAWTSKARVSCDRLETTEDSTSRRGSLSLRDMITLVTAFAALVYPSTVVFSLENWHSPLAFFGWVAGTMGWTLGIAAMVYLVARSWLEEERGSTGSLLAWAIAGAFLLGSLMHDWISVEGALVESFFGIRASFRLVALPAAFVATAIGAIGLRRCGFRVARPARASEPTQMAAAAEQSAALRPSPLAAATSEKAIAPEKSPWD